MPTSASATAEALREILARFGVAPDEVRDIRAGRVNRHWRIVAGGAPYALRRYTGDRTPDAIAYEHTMLARLAARGWPVAAPLRSRDDTTLAEAGGSRYALFPFLPGRPAPYSSVRYLAIKGRLLARLHADMAAAPLSGQRPGFGRVWELDALGAADSSTFNGLLRAFGREQPALASALRAQRYASLRELSRLGYGELPDVFVHWDFHHDNLLFRRGELTGVLDFDSLHRDARVADIAQSILLDCLEPPAYNAISVDGMRAFVRGYHEAAALSATEHALIVPLLPALVIARSADNLRAWLRAGVPRALQSLGRATQHRLPTMARQRAELEQAVAEATR